MLRTKEKNMMIKIMLIVVCILAIIVCIKAYFVYKDSLYNIGPLYIVFGFVFVALILATIFIPQTNIDNLTNQELSEYITEIDENELDNWFNSLTDEQQTRVFYLYMVNKLETESVNDSF